MTEITLLGTAALMPMPDRALSAAYLDCAGRGILFDCGEGTQAAARRAGISLMKTAVIAITHFHGDHYFGLPGLLQSMNALDRKEPLYITGPEGLEREMQPIFALAGLQKFEIKLLPMEEGGIELRNICPGFPQGARLTGFKTEHRIESLGYIFTLPRAGKFLPEKAEALGLPMEYRGRLQRGETVEHMGQRISPEMVMGQPRRGISFVFAGDTAPCKALERAAREADLLISDATYALDEHEAQAKQYGHMSFKQAAQLAADAGARRLWLSHFSPMVKNPEEHMDAVREIFPAAECGRDGMSIKLSFD